MKPLLLVLGLTAAVAGYPAESKEKESGKSKPVKATGLFESFQIDGPGAMKPADLITTSLGGRDVEFLTTVIENSRVISWLGEMARSKTESEEVRAVANALQSTQAEENEYITRLAGKLGVRIPEGKAPAQKGTLEEELSPLRGPKLDKALLDHFVIVGQTAVAAYTQGSHSSDEEIKRFSAQMLPAAKEKLQLASKMAGMSTEATTPAFRTGTPKSPPGTE